VRLLRDCGLLSFWGESRLGSVNLTVPAQLLFAEEALAAHGKNGVYQAALSSCPGGMRSLIPACGSRLPATIAFPETFQDHPGDPETKKNPVLAALWSPRRSHSDFPPQNQAQIEGPQIAIVSE